MLFFKLFNWNENITYKPKGNKKNNIIDEILEIDPFFFSY